MVPWLTTKSVDERVSIVKFPPIAETTDGFFIAPAIDILRFNGPVHYVELQIPVKVTVV
jgi:hypothetical protein